MPGDNANTILYHWSGAYKGKIGRLIGPSRYRRHMVKPWMPYALDNDAFKAWTDHLPWDEAKWIEMIKDIQLLCVEPLWVLVPDTVADKQSTLCKWEKYSPLIRWKKAFAVQDGMTPDDVPNDADVVFVGGTTEWKWRNLPVWTNHFKRVHVGRCNELYRLQRCEELGVESVDGSGWFREGESDRRFHALKAWVEGIEYKNMELQF